MCTHTHNLPVRLYMKSLAGKSHVSRWTKEEQALFLEGLVRFGRKWSLYTTLIPTRSKLQIRSHAQKVLAKVKIEFPETRQCCERCASPSSAVEQREIGVQCGGEDGRMEGRALEEEFGDMDIDIA